MGIDDLRLNNVHSVYLAGPMTGIPEYNFPAFNDATKRMREAGLTVFNPAELDDPWDTAKTDPLDLSHIGGAQWQRYLKRDLIIIATLVHGVVAMPGWWNSKGARLETHTAWELGMPVYQYPDFNLIHQHDRSIVLQNMSKELNGGINEETYATTV